MKGTTEPLQCRSEENVKGALESYLTLKRLFLAYICYFFFGKQCKIESLRVSVYQCVATLGAGGAISSLRPTYTSAEWAAHFAAQVAGCNNCLEYVPRVLDGYVLQVTSLHSLFSTLTWSDLVWVCLFELGTIPLAWSVGISLQTLAEDPYVWAGQVKFSTIGFYTKQRTNIFRCSVVLIDRGLNLHSWKGVEGRI